MTRQPLTDRQQQVLDMREHAQGNLFQILGWTPPESKEHDPFWFRADHGPVHVDDIWPFILAEVGGMVIERIAPTYIKSDDLEDGGAY